MGNRTGPGRCFVAPAWERSLARFWHCEWRAKYHAQTCLLGPAASEEGGVGLASEPPRRSPAVRGTGATCGQERMLRPIRGYPARHEAPARSGSERRSAIRLRTRPRPYNLYGSFCQEQGGPTTPVPTHPEPAEGQAHAFNSFNSNTYPTQSAISAASLLAASFSAQPTEPTSAVTPPTVVSNRRVRILPSGCCNTASKRMTAELVRAS